MQEIHTLLQYFPMSIAASDLKKYLHHHFEHFIKCSENELYSSAYSHLHILYMIFVYIQLIRIANEKSQEFNLCWVGFPKQEQDFLKDPTSPFSFSKVQEKTVFRFFRLVGFDDGTTADISELVNKRNNHLHANGKIFFEQLEDFEREVGIYLKKMQAIVEKQKKFLETIYLSLIENYEDDFEITEDEIKN